MHDGRKMLFVIKVLEPKLKDPVKDIERVYLREKSQAFGFRRAPCKLRSCSGSSSPWSP